MAGKRSRIYWRADGGRVPRAWADFRDYADVGGQREPLVPPGVKHATTDPDVAGVLVGKRLEQLEARRHCRGMGVGTQEPVTLAAFAARHLTLKAKARRVTTRWLAESEKRLTAAVAFFGATRPLDQITVADVQAWVGHLQAASNGRGAVLSDGTQRHYLHALSNLFRRAQAEGAVAPGYNPVAGLLEKPQARRLEARWLEVPAAAVLLEAARTLTREKPSQAAPFAYPLIATMLLTGGRPAEVLGLEVSDVSFDRQTVTFRPTATRRLKTVQSFRTVPLWPQLREILGEYLATRPPGRLLFPSPTPGPQGEERQLRDVRKLLDAVAARAGWTRGAIRAYIFRHTYCAARLQTLDRGAPVSPFTVGREMGHGGTALVNRVYGHLGQHPHRAEAVEYRVEQHLTVRIRDQQTVADLLSSLSGLSPELSPGLQRGVSQTTEA